MKNQKIDHFLKLASRVEHSGSDYISHCLGVYEILQEMGTNEDVCYAGLFHSIYGTEYFGNNSIPTRNEIKSIIGKYAENLAYIFCTMHNRHSSLLKNNENFDTMILKDLLLIEYANLKEQSKRNPHVELKNLYTTIYDEVKKYA